MSVSEGESARLRHHPLSTPDTADRRVVYFDTHMRRGYLSECSIPVSILHGKMAYDEAGGKKALDLTPPEGGTRGTGRSTGPSPTRGNTG